MSCSDDASQGGQLKIFALLLFLLAQYQAPRTPDAYETAYPGLDFAVHSAFIKCYVNHWKGSETVAIKGSQSKVKMTCDGFWDLFVRESESPITADYMPSPFKIIEPDPNSLGNIGIPFSVWNGYLSATIAISESNPIRNNQ